MLAIDVDHFHYINDTYGHATGDELLGSVAALLQSRLRETDVIGRLGGDEFGVILPQTALKDAEKIARALVENARAQVQTVRDGRKVRATLSIGIQEIDPATRAHPGRAAGRGRDRAQRGQGARPRPVRRRRPRR